jgi:penicillin-binding protein 1C
MDFKEVTICRQTGYLAGTYCDDKETLEVPINMTPLKICPYHICVFVDKDEKYTVCSYCWSEGYHEKHYLIYPASVNYQLKQRGLLADVVPSHNPLCPKLSGNNPLQFLYPLDSARIWIPRDFGGKRQKLIAKIAHNNPAKKVFWYLDDEYLGCTKNNNIMAIDINQGWHDLIVVDDDGYKDKVRFHSTYATAK